MSDLKSVSVRQYGDRVLVIEDGRLLWDLPWQAALALSRGLQQKGKLAEEHANANSIIMDQALLIRAGIPFGLTNRPDMLREAVKEADTNRDLRRYLPGGIKSEAIVGTPTIIQLRPKPFGLLTAGNGENHHA